MAHRHTNLCQEINRSQKRRVTLFKKNQTRTSSRNQVHGTTPHTVAATTANSQTANRPYAARTGDDVVIRELPSGT